MTDLELMQSIKTRHGDAIAAVCRTSSIPPAFIAALIANESGGDPNAKRFEHGVLVSLWKVLLGRTATYGSISAAALKQFIAGLATPPVSTPQSLPTDAFQRLDSLATSWGLTQIMGYHVLDVAVGSAFDPQTLAQPQISLANTIRLLTEFVQRFQLDVTQEFDQLFRCWNTGSPTGKTFDPNYSLNGMARMAIWTSLP